MLGRNAVAIYPALDRCVISMAQLARNGAYAPALTDDFSIGHFPDLHCTRTIVNVENVSECVDYPYMADDETTGEALTRLRERSGLTMRALASAAGYKHASGIQRYVEPSNAKPLPTDAAQKFVTALAGLGKPPIEAAEIWRLTSLPAIPNASPAPPMEGASEERMRRDVPIYGTALGAEKIIDGEAIEQTTLNTGETVGYVRRPVLLDGRADVYALYVQGSSMSPRHRDGATLFVERRQPHMGDDCVIYMRVPDEHDGERPSCVLVKTLVRKTANYVELEQYSPAITFRLDTAQVERMDRVIPWDDLIA